jgi:hypothetical protein
MLTEFSISSSLSPYKCPELREHCGFVICGWWRFSYLDNSAAYNLDSVSPRTTTSTTTETIAVRKCAEARSCRTCHSFSQILHDDTALVLKHICQGTNSSMSSIITMMNGGLSGGTGQKLTRATIIVAGVSSLVASLLSIVSV